MLAPSMVLAGGGPALMVGDATGGPGDTVNVTLSYTGDGATENFQGDISFDGSVLDFVECPQSFPPTVTFQEIDANTIRFVTANGTGFTIENFFTDGFICDMAFAIDGAAAAPSSEALDLNSTSYFTASGEATPSGERDGTITIQAGPPPASLTASPSSVDLLVEGLGNSDSESVSFTAADGDVSGLSCDFTGDSEISVGGDVPSDVSQDSSFSLNVSCSAGTEDSFGGTLSCTHDDGSTDVPVSCDSVANPAVPAADPADGGTLFIGPLNPGASGSRNVTFSELGGDTGYSVENCALASGADFSLSGTDGFVSAGGSAVLTVTANSPASVVSDTLSCDINANGQVSDYSITVTVGFRPLVVPTLQQWGMILMALMLAGFGFMTLRRRDV